LMKLLLTDIPGTCLHLSCHGNSAGLQLEDRIGCMEPLAVATIRKLLTSSHRDSCLEVAVLLCCNSEQVARVLVDAGVRHVVCTRGQLHDRSARRFTEAFWSSVASSDCSIEEGFHRALVLLRAHSHEECSDANLLVLLPTDPENRSSPSDVRKLASDPCIQRKLSSRVHSSKQKQFRIEKFSALPEDFVGREFMHCRVLACFEGRGGQARRAVCVHGEEGIGKTDFVRMLARFVSNPGRLFDGGVLFDPVWSSRSEPLPWLWLEAVWRMTEGEPWKQEEAGLQPTCNTEMLVDRLCAELEQIHARSLLLIVENADEVQSFVMDDMLGKLLRTTSIRVLLTARNPWHQDIHGYKVVDVQLQKLDALSSAKLFLRRVRRPLHKRDFDEFNHGTMYKATTSSAASPDEWQSHVTALLRHPLLQLLDGHPARIRRAAEQVTEKLPSLYHLCEKISASKCE